MSYKQEIICCYGPTGPTGPQGIQGLTGATGPTGSQGEMINFCYEQLIHVLSQIITLYPTDAITVYSMILGGGSPGFSEQLYGSPQGTNAGLLVMNLGGGYVGNLPLQTIAGFAFPNSVVYNPSITYLTPSALPPGWNTNILLAIHDTLSIGQHVEVRFGNRIVQGTILKNEYGMIVVNEPTADNSPVFITTCGIGLLYKITP